MRFAPLAMVVLAGCGTMIASDFQSSLTPRAVGAIGIATGVLAASLGALAMAADEPGGMCTGSPDDGSVFQSGCSYPSGVFGAFLIAGSLFDFYLGAKHLITNRYSTSLD